jgi:hypothetical protein
LGTREKARAELKAYDPELWADILARKGSLGEDGAMVSMTRAGAEEDAQGNLSLKLSARNLGYGDNHRNQILNLGNIDNPEQTKAAVYAYHRGGDASSGEMADKHSPAVESRFHLFQLGVSPSSESTPQHFFAAPGEKDGSEPVLTTSDKSGVPEGKTLARVPVLHPILFGPASDHAAPKRSDDKTDEEKKATDKKADEVATRNPPAVISAGSNTAAPGGESSAGRTAKASVGSAVPKSTDKVEMVSAKDKEQAALVTKLCAKCHGEASNKVAAKSKYLFTPDKLISKKGLKNILEAITEADMPADKDDFAVSGEGKALISWLEEKIK